MFFYIYIFYKNKILIYFYYFLFVLLYFFSRLINFNFFDILLVSVFKLFTQKMNRISYILYLKNHFYIILFRFEIKNRNINSWRVIYTMMWNKKKKIFWQTGTLAERWKKDNFTLKKNYINKDDNNITTMGCSWMRECFLLFCFVILFVFSF